jgi:hypothetical protein
MQVPYWEVNSHPGSKYIFPLVTEPEILLPCFTVFRLLTLYLANWLQANSHTLFRHSNNILTPYLSLPSDLLSSAVPTRILHSLYMSSVDVMHLARLILPDSIIVMFGEEWKFKTSYNIFFGLIWPSTLWESQMRE